jgi:hypothetical protein
MGGGAWQETEQAQGGPQPHIQRAVQRRDASTDQEAASDANQQLQRMRMRTCEYMSASRDACAMHLVCRVSLRTVLQSQTPGFVGRRGALQRPEGPELPSRKQGA